MFTTIRVNEMTFHYIGNFGIMHCLSGDTKSTHRINIIWDSVVVAKLLKVRPVVAKPVVLDVVELA